MPQRTGRPRGHTPDGAEIRRLRLDRGWTAGQLADQVGRHPESIRRAEAGRPISDVFASRLALALGVEVEDIASPPAKVPAA